MNDDYAFSVLEARYDDMTADKLAAMTTEERGEYYHALYQYFGRMLLIVHEAEPNDGDDDLYPTMSGAEYHALSAVHNSFMAVLDGLAGLVDIASETWRMTVSEMTPGRAEATRI